MEFPDDTGALAAQKLLEIRSEIQEAKIRGTITGLKNGKSPGMDFISTKMVKCIQEATIKKLHVLFNKVMAKQKIPSPWR